MPSYNYACKQCDHEFSDLLKIDDRKIPCEKPCPGCGAEDSIYLKIGAPKLVTGTTTPLKQAGSGWKDVLSKVKEGSGSGHTIHD